jgi:integrase/recombinase XerD
MALGPVAESLQPSSLTEGLASSPAATLAANQASTDDRLVELWLHGRSPHTQRAYAADVLRFRARAGKPLRQVTLSDLQEFADSFVGVLRRRVGIDRHYKNDTLWLLCKR